MRISMFSVTALLLLVSSAHGFTVPSIARPPLILHSSLAGTDEASWKAEGERIIRNAAIQAGAQPEMVSIEWKSERIIVTIDGSAYIEADADADEDQMFIDDIEGNGFMEGDELDDFDEDDEDVEFDMDELDAEFEQDFAEEEEKPVGVNVVEIAKAINAAFDSEGEGSVGYNIAVHHSIEVTTPGATDELSGIMFEAYKGFDVIVEFEDAKTGKAKKVEGKLVEKDDEFLRINERGRMRKFKNELVKSVKLPKAKSEKGNSSKKSNKPKASRKKRK